jgi:adenosine deaminase
MVSSVNQALDQNNTLGFRFSYIPEQNVIMGGLLKSPYEHFNKNLVENAADMTSVVINGQEISLKRTDSSVGPQQFESVFQYPVTSTDEKFSLQIKLNNQTFGSYEIDGQSGAITGGATSKLVAFETRLMAGTKDLMDVPYDRSKGVAFKAKTDLHTQLAGNLSSKKLIELALNKPGEPITYPTYLLESLNIDTTRYIVKDQQLAVRDLDLNDLLKLEMAMAIPVDKQDTFNGMEGIYQYRGPITKNKDLFKDILREIGRDYAASGTTYAELSHASIITDPELLRMANEVLPEIEQETGVKIRFLAAMWRHSDKEWNQDEVDRIKAIAESPYVVCAGFMGHETNPTRDFVSEIKELAKWAVRNNPDFTVRVHAGENPLFASAGYKNAQESLYDFHNVKEVLQAVKEARAEVAKEMGVEPETLPMPRVRIGHGLYGLDEETIALFRETGAIVEFNMSSNLALNNINDISEIPISRYIDAGIPVVLGHDGKGVYKTDPEQEALLAGAAGVTEQGFALMKQTEDKHIARDQKRFESKVAAYEQKLEEIRKTLLPDGKSLSDLPQGERDKIENEVFKRATVATYSTPDQKPRMTAEVAARYAEARKSEEANLLSSVTKQYDGVPVVTDPTAVAANLEGKTPILLTGASKNAWPKIADPDKEEIRVAMQVLSNWVDTDKAYVMTGGTHFGVEARLHEAGYLANADASNDKKLRVVGGFTVEALGLKAGQVTKIEDNTITDAVVLKMNGRLSQRWFDLQDAALNIVDENKGVVLAVAGGPVVSDMIQRAHNMGLDLMLMDGPMGASTDKSKSLKGNGYSFVGAQGLLEKLHEMRPELFKPGFDVSQAAEYVTQARAQIQAASAGTDMSGVKGEQAFKKEVSVAAG